MLWDKGQVTIDAIGLQAEPDVVGAQVVNVLSRGKAELAWIGPRRCIIPCLSQSIPGDKYMTSAPNQHSGDFLTPATVPYTIVR